MAAVFNASGDGLNRTSGVPSESAFTITLWFLPVGSGGSYGQIVGGLGRTDFNPIPCLLLKTDDLYINDADGIETLLLSNLPASWHFAALSCGATGATALKGYCATGTTALSTASGVMSSFTQNVIMLGCSYDATVYFNGFIAAVKIWNAALTQAEIEQERWQYLPNRLANLHLFSPLINTGGTSFLDISGAGRNWTEAGTVTDGDGPPIPWKMGRHRILIPAYIEEGETLEFSASSSGASDTTGIGVSIERRIAPNSKGDSDTGSIDATILRKLVASILGDSTTTSSGLNVLRKFISSVIGDSDTPSVDLNFLISFAASAAGSSYTRSINLWHTLAERSDVTWESGDVSLESGDVIWGDAPGAPVVTFTVSSKGDSNTGVVDAAVLRKFVVVSDGSSDTPAADLSILRNFVCSSTGDSDVSVTYLNVLRKLIVSSLGGSLTAEIDLAIAGIVLFVAYSSGDSSTSGAALSVLRKLIASALGSSDTADVDAAVLRKVTSSAVGDSLTGNIVLDAGRYFEASSKGDSDTVASALQVLRKFQPSALGDSLTNNIALRIPYLLDDLIFIWDFPTNFINFTAATSGDSQTGVIDINVLRKFVASSLGDSLTLGIALNILRKLVASSIGDSLTSNITLDITGLINFIVSVAGDSQTSDIDLLSQILFSVSAEGSSLTSGANLNRLIKVTAVSEGSSIITLPGMSVLRSLTTSSSGYSLTSLIDLLTDVLGDIKDPSIRRILIERMINTSRYKQNREIRQVLAASLQTIPGSRVIKTE